MTTPPHGPRRASSPAARGAPGGRPAPPVPGCFARRTAASRVRAEKINCSTSPNQNTGSASPAKETIDAARAGHPRPSAATRPSGAVKSPASRRRRGDELQRGRKPLEHAVGDRAAVAVAEAPVSREEAAQPLHVLPPDGLVEPERALQSARDPRAARPGWRGRRRAVRPAPRWRSPKTHGGDDGAADAARAAGGTPWRAGLAATPMRGRSRRRRCWSDCR